ncbi:MAG: hypothetical protein AB8G99_19620 [Planctomycetaceae bacterium]
MTDSSQPDAEPRKRKGLLICTAIALAAWMLILAGFTQVPKLVVVNHVQVRRADLMVTARVVDRDKKLVEITKVWSGKQPDESSINIVNLNEVAVEAGKDYLMPLWNDGRIVKVQRRRKASENRPDVYADSEEMRAQVAEALAKGRIRE